jgi:hypothetical protein
MVTRFYSWFMSSHARSHPTRIARALLALAHVAHRQGFGPSSVSSRREQCERHTHRCRCNAVVAANVGHQSDPVAALRDGAASGRAGASRTLSAAAQAHSCRGCKSAWEHVQEAHRIASLLASTTAHNESFALLVDQAHPWLDEAESTRATSGIAVGARGGFATRAIRGYLFAPALSTARASLGDAAARNTNGTELLYQNSEADAVPINRASSQYSACHEGGSTT